MRTRLTPFAKFLLLLVIAAALFLVTECFLIPVLSTLKQMIPKLRNKKEAPKTDQVPANFEAQSLLVYCPAPQNGTLKGSLNWTPPALNSFIVEIDQNKNWQLKKGRMGNSLVYDGTASGRISQGLKQYIANMLDYGVGSRISFRSQLRRSK